jgi:PEGA domain
VAAFKRVGTTIGAAVAAATLGLATMASAQIVVGGGYPYPAYRYAAPDAAVKFDVKPKETMVYVDGYYAGIVDDFDGAFQRLRTQPGGHQLTLYLEGYRTYTEQVYLAADNTFKLKHRMERLGAGEASQRPPAPQPPQYQPGPEQVPPPGPVGRRGRAPAYPYPPPGQPGFPPNDGRGGPDANARGTLSLTLQPGDADVLLDGQLRRGTPAGDRLTFEVPPGRHNIQIRKAGFIGYLTDVQIRPGETTELDVRLKTQP